MLRNAWSKVGFKVHDYFSLTLSRHELWTDRARGWRNNGIECDASMHQSQVIKKLWSNEWKEKRPINAFECDRRLHNSSGSRELLSSGRTTFVTNNKPFSVQSPIERSSYYWKIRLSNVQLLLMFVFFFVSKYPPIKVESLWLEPWTLISTSKGFEWKHSFRRSKVNAMAWFKD